jgi:hypothetical protein
MRLLQLCLSPPASPWFNISGSPKAPTAPGPGRNNWPKKKRKKNRTAKGRWAYEHRDPQPACPPSDLAPPSGSPQGRRHYAQCRLCAYPGLCLCRLAIRTQCPRSPRDLHRRLPDYRECHLPDERSKPSTVNDWSTTIAGLLLALTLPPGFPLWMAAVAGVFGIAVGKAFFGGLGFNVMNPALVGRAFARRPSPFP